MNAPDRTNTPRAARADGYESFYREFDAPWMREFRREAYGEDIGQHSWVSTDELRADTARLRLAPSSRLLDLGCGPAGPLAFVVATVGCAAVGVELSPSAVRAGRLRCAALEIGGRFSVEEADLNEPLRFAPASFDAAMSLDVVLHLRYRLKFFLEAARLLRDGGRFVFTDAGVITGAVSNEDIRRRSIHGYTQFIAPGCNERLLESAGFRLVETEDRTESVLKNAAGRLVAMRTHRAELERLQGAPAWEEQRSYLETVVELSRSRAISRIMYLAQACAPTVP